MLEPLPGFEPGTYGLRNRCSTPELQRQGRGYLLPETGELRKRAGREEIRPDDAVWSIDEGPPGRRSRPDLVACCESRCTVTEPVNDWKLVDAHENPPRGVAPGM